MVKRAVLILLPLLCLCSGCLPEPESGDDETAGELTPTPHSLDDDASSEATPTHQPETSVPGDDDTSSEATPTHLPETSVPGDDDSTLSPIDGDGDGFPSDQDCDDQNAQVYPGADEVCDGINNDCDQEVDEGLLFTYYRDEDGDGFGVADSSTLSCPPSPSGYADMAGDCDDTDATTYAGAEESCDDKDNDCDTAVDEGARLTCHPDTDLDGYGDPDVTVETCALPEGWVVDGTDCDDTRKDVFPGAVELCDDLDNDCDQKTDGCWDVTRWDKCVWK